MRKMTPDHDFLLAKDWLTAFQNLITCLELNSDEKKIVFIDELPWFHTPRSGFISALEHFWNSWASTRNDVVLIACGSAASWMINKLINNKGGLHNRVTKRMKIVPFTLNECEQFLEQKNTLLDRYQIIQLYSKYAEELRNKVGTFKNETKTRKSVFITLISTFGLQTNSSFNRTCAERY